LIDGRGDPLGGVPWQSACRGGVGERDVVVAEVEDGEDPGLGRPRHPLTKYACRFAANSLLSAGWSDALVAA